MLNSNEKTNPWYINRNTAYNLAEIILEWFQVDSSMQTCTICTEINIQGLVWGGKVAGVVSEYIFWGYREGNRANGLVLRGELHEKFQSILFLYFISMSKRNKNYPETKDNLLSTEILKPSTLPVNSVCFWWRPYISRAGKRKRNDQEKHSERWLSYLFGGFKKMVRNQWA